MNTEILDELLNRYEANMDMLYDSEHDELFKWAALKTFRKEWFAPANAYPDFISRFQAATKDFSIFIDNSRMHPRNGVIKLFEKDPVEVEWLFERVLFAPDGGDLGLRQQHMDEFIAGMEKLRVQYFPANWSFKQDRHAASTYLAMYAPAENYVYKFREAETMAVYGEYGFSIGSGAGFSLEYYYKMCDEIRERLQEHPSLLENHFAALGDSHTREESLHLLAFDVIYCCYAYGFFKGIEHKSKKEAIKASVQSEKEQAGAAEKQARREELRGQLAELLLSLPDVSEISLLDTEVTFAACGTGKVIEQELNMIKVQFADTVKSFNLDRKFSRRPHFENDEEVVELFSVFNDMKAKILELEKQLAALG